MSAPSARSRPSSREPRDENAPASSRPGSSRARLGTTSSSGSTTRPVLGSIPSASISSTAAASARATRSSTRTARPADKENTRETTTSHAGAGKPIRTVLGSTAKPSRPPSNAAPPPTGKPARDTVRTPRRALSVLGEANGQAATPLAPLPPSRIPPSTSARAVRPGPKRTNTNPLFVSSDAAARPPPPLKSKSRKTKEPSPDATNAAVGTSRPPSASAATSSGAKLAALRRTKTPTPAPELARDPSPHTPTDRIGINPLKRGAPTTFDRNTDRKFRRIDEVDSEPRPQRVVVLDDEVEECVPSHEIGFIPASPPASRRAEAREHAIDDEEHAAPSPPGLGDTGFALPPIPAEHDGADDLGLEMPELLDPQMLELDLGMLDLPDMDFIV